MTRSQGSRASESPRSRSSPVPGPMRCASSLPPTELSGRAIPATAGAHDKGAGTGKRPGTVEPRRCAMAATGKSFHPNRFGHPSRKCNSGVRVAKPPRWTHNATRPGHHQVARRGTSVDSALPAHAAGGKVPRYQAGERLRAKALDWNPGIGLDGGAAGGQNPQEGSLPWSTLVGGIPVVLGQATAVQDCGTTIMAPFAMADRRQCDPGEALP